LIEGATTFVMTAGNSLTLTKIGSGWFVIGPVPLRKFESGLMSVASFAVPHGLGAIPSRTATVLKIIAVGGGYSIGDEVSVDQVDVDFQGNFLFGCEVKASTSSLEVNVGADGFRGVSNYVLNNTNARLIVRAWL
jgi:hypothetical protein